jgi:hypothetical protein
MPSWGGAPLKKNSTGAILPLSLFCLFNFALDCAVRDIGETQEGMELYEISYNFA